jgi:hypothetical protein
MTQPPIVIYEQAPPPKILEFVAWMRTHPHEAMSAEAMLWYIRETAPLFGLTMDDEGRLSVVPCQ